MTEEDLKFAEGDFIYYLCKSCDQSCGGGISNKETDKWRQNDPYNPTKKPCIFCGKGPVVIIKS